MRPATAAWAAYLAAAGLLSGYAIARWLEALVLRQPLLYGEGAVANAARLARDRIAYVDADPQRFVAANYPPLYLHAASLGDPFVAGRLISIGATLAAAITVYLAARSAGRLVAISLAVGWLALAPVAIWGAAIKPDLLALGLTGVAVLLLDRRRDLAAVAGAAIVFAVFAKPTALLPGLSFLGWLAWADRRALSRYAFGAAAAMISVAATVALDSPPDIWRHVVVWNTLAWSPEPAVLLAIVGVIVLGIPAGIAGLAGGWQGARAAYLVGALAIVVAGGREGATVNYLLDLGLAASFALAAVADRLRQSTIFPAAAVAQLVIATAFLGPLGVAPGRTPTTGSWGDPARAGAIAAELARGGPLLVEDSGLLVANGAEPTVDDLFLWSRLVTRGTIDAAPIVEQVRARRFSAIATEVDLERIDSAAAFERQRWADLLVRAILDRYRLDRHEAALWIYVPR
jgi:hypothetical protein